MTSFSIAVRFPTSGYICNQGESAARTNAMPFSMESTTGHSTFSRASMTQDSRAHCADCRMLSRYSARVRSVDSS